MYPNIVENVAVDVEEKTAIARILFMARKVIAFHWLDISPPTIQELINKLMAALFGKRDLLKTWGTPKI